MNTLDPRSLIAMGGLMALVMGVVLGFTRRYYPPSIRGVGYWASAPAAMLGAAVLFGFSAPAYPEIWRWFANGLIVLGFLLFYVGFVRFVDQPARWRRLVVFYSVAMLLMAWFAVVDPSYRMRVAVASASIGAIELATLLVLLRHGNRNFPVRMVQIVLILHVCVLLVRIQTAYVGQDAGNLLEASAVQTFYLGAYVMAGLLLATGSLLMATDQVRSELEHMATHDGLTSSLNRRAILAFGQDEHERSARYGRTFSLMMMDLDHFKSINDTNGHQHGDRVLVHFADSAREALRRADRFGRYGGEEFLAILPNTEIDTAAPVAERIHVALCAGHALDCKVSIGLTSWQGPDDSLDAMLGRADAALYKAKSQGRGQTCVT